MNFDKQLSLEEHCDIADDLAIAKYHLERAFQRVSKHYPMSHKLMKGFWKILPGVFAGNQFTNIQNELDKEYHKTLTDSDFGTFGHIYFNLEKRYKQIQESNQTVRLLK